MNGHKIITGVIVIIALLWLWYVVMDVVYEYRRKV